MARGARVQRPLWASTSTKDPAYPDTLYVDQLIGPDTVNTMPEDTLDAFVDHGTVARTVDADPAAAQGVLDRLGAVGVDLDDVGRVLEDQGVAAFAKSFDELIEALEAKAAELGAAELADVHGELVVVDDVPGEFAERVIEAFHARPNDGFSLAVSGGDTARAAYERLADDAGTQIDWWKVDVYWGDERCVPHDSPGVQLPPGPHRPARAGRGRQRQLPDVLRGGPRPLPAASRRAGQARRRPPRARRRRPHRLAVPGLGRRSTPTPVAWSS